jgi:hypothetical protein
LSPQRCESEDTRADLYSARPQEEAACRNDTRPGPARRPNPG